MRHEVLIGVRMHSAEILSSLHRESEILTDCGKEFEIMQGNFDGQIIRAFNHRYVTLYYFTHTQDGLMDRAKNQRLSKR